MTELVVHTCSPIYTLGSLEQGNHEFELAQAVDTHRLHLKEKKEKDVLTTKVNLFLRVF